MVQLYKKKFETRIKYNTTLITMNLYLCFVKNDIWMRYIGDHRVKYYYDI